MSALLFVVMYPLAGLTSLVIGNPFSLAVGGFTAAAYLALRPAFDRRLALATLAIGSIAQWLSIGLTEKRLPGALQDPYAPMSTAGFPFTAFTYPHPPMGGDVPPLEQWPWFFLNYAFWIAIAAVVVGANRAQLRTVAALRVIVYGGFLFWASGLGMTLLKFD